jgi:TonB-linked SusC/RagA family outer membrane protein
MRRIVLFSICMLFMVMHLFAQSRNITGKVTDDKGVPLSNASIIVKGTSIGTTTNSSGIFQIKVPSSASSLIATYVGMADKEVPVSGRNLTIQMSSAGQTGMQEVVVVAYGQQQKKAITGAMNTISSESIKRQQVVSATSALQGLAPGVLVINGSGEPGDNPSIRIRGVGSYLASAEPLIVVDGTPFTGNINTLNPNDIESMNVLKDATATALYGSRAANGVILITTKQGRRNRVADINLYSSYGVSSRAVKEYPYVNSDQYMRLAWEAQRNAAIDAGISNPGQYATNNFITGANGLQYNPYSVANPIDTNGVLLPNAQLLWDTDWNKALGNDNSTRKNVGVNISGGAEKVRYYFSTDYLQQNGFVLNSDFKRISVRLNTEAELRIWLTTGINMSVSSSNQNYPTQAGTASRNAVGFARNISSIYPLYMRDDNGQLVLDANGNPQYDFGNPITGRTINHNRPVVKNFNAVAVQTLDRILNDRLETSLNSFGEVRFTDYLKFRSNIGVERYLLSGSNYFNPLYGDAAPVKGRVSKSRNLTTSYTWTNSLNFQKSFGNHNIGAMVSSEAYDFKQENVAATRTNFPAPGIFEISAGATAESSSSSTNRHRIESYLGRFTYNFNNKYFLEATFRRDGSTRFAPENRWGSFYSIGGSWLLSSEKFLRDIDWLNLVKIRASYGEVGNENIGTNYFPYISEFSTGWNDLGNAGVVITSMTNREISWEKLGTYNVGVDFSVFKNRVSGSIDYYNKNTFDLLFPRPIQPSSGFTEVNENVGSMTNKGFEVVLNTKNIDKKDLSWESNFNLGTVKNTITALPPEQQKILASPFQLEVGKSISEFYIIQWAGVNAQTGEPQWYKDEMVNGSATGRKILTNNNSDATRYYFGSALPRITGGFNNTFRYKIVDVSFLFNYAFGGKILDEDYIGLMHGMSVVGGQLHTDILNRWQKPGDITDVPRLSFKNYVYAQYSTRQLFSGDYVRLRNITMGVSLPNSLIKNQNVIKNLRFYIQGDNLFTWLRDAKQGLDPEVGVNGVTNNSSSVFKTISVGFNVGF